MCERCVDSAMLQNAPHACVRVYGGHVAPALAVPPVQCLVHVAEGHQGNCPFERDGVEGMPQVPVPKITCMHSTSCICILEEMQSCLVVVQFR